LAGSSEKGVARPRPLQQRTHGGGERERERERERALRAGRVEGRGRKGGRGRKSDDRKIGCLGHQIHHQRIRDRVVGPDEFILHPYRGARETDRELESESLGEGGGGVPCFLTPYFDRR